MPGSGFSTPGLYSSSISISQSAAAQQASGTLETQRGTVTNTYLDPTTGNVIGADVLIAGEVYSRANISNATGIKLWNGATVTVNNVMGNTQGTQITGLGSGGSAVIASQSALVAMNAAAQAALPGVPGQAISDAPMLLAYPDTTEAPNGYPVDAGSNIYFTAFPPSVNGSGGGIQSGEFEFTVVPQVGTVLPNPLTTLLPVGTLFDLHDNYFNSLGMYRLDQLGSTYVWHRRDAGTGGSSGGSTGTFATQVFSPSGSVNSFTLTNTPIGAVIVSYRPAAGQVFNRYDPTLVTVSGNVVTMSDTSVSGSTVLIDYLHA